jgi:hypothetical protein
VKHCNDEPGSRCGGRSPTRSDRRVLTGLAANERLPAEAELATRFGSTGTRCARPSPRSKRKELLRAEQGRGTFLNDRKRLRYPIGPRTRFSSGLEEPGTRPGRASCSRARPCPPRFMSPPRCLFPPAHRSFNLRRSRPPTGCLSRQRHRGLTPAGSAKLPSLYAQTGSITASAGAPRGRRLHPQDHRRGKPGMQPRGSRSARPFARRHRALDRASRHRCGRTAGAVTANRALRPTELSCSSNTIPRRRQTHPSKR